MNQEKVTKYLKVLTSKMPDFFNLNSERTELREVFDSYAIFVFDIAEPLTIGDFTEIIDETIGVEKLYHHYVSADTEFGHSFCAFHIPLLDQMFKLNAATDASGRITRISATFYDSMERQCFELREELHRMQAKAGEFYDVIGEDELLTHFL